MLLSIIGQAAGRCQPCSTTINVPPDGLVTGGLRSLSSLSGLLSRPFPRSTFLQKPVWLQAEPACLAEGCCASVL